MGSGVVATPGGTGCDDGPVIVDRGLYVDGARRPCGDLSDELAALRRRGPDGSFLWIGLKDPTATEFDEVDEELGLHPLAVEDAVRGRQRPKAVLHAIVDSVVDGYRAIDAEIETDIEEIEATVFSGSSMGSATVYRLKREVLEFRRAAVPFSVALETLHEQAAGVDEEGEIQLLLRDVADHLHSVIDHIESYDRLLTDILGAHLAQISVQQNSDMRKISAWVAIAAVPTMIAGIYGMNFDNMPELHWYYGYFGVLAIMAVACGGLYRAFKRSGWL